MSAGRIETPEEEVVVVVGGGALIFVHGNVQRVKEFGRLVGFKGELEHCSATLHTSNKHIHALEIVGVHGPPPASPFSHMNALAKITKKICVYQRNHTCIGRAERRRLEECFPRADCEIRPVGIPQSTYPDIQKGGVG